MSSTLPREFVITGGNRIGRSTLWGDGRDHVTIGSFAHLDMLRAYEANLQRAVRDSALGYAPTGENAMYFVNYDGMYLVWKNKRVGFWRESIFPDKGDTLPFPVIQNALGFNLRRASTLVGGPYLQPTKEIFVSKLVDIQANQAKASVQPNPLPNRLNGGYDGNVVYSYKGFTWPESYLTYILLGVLPSREFYQMVMGGLDLDTLPSYSGEKTS